MSFISVSVDLTRSTEIKNEISLISKNNPQHRDEMLLEYARKVAYAEAHFYDAIENSGIGIERVFLFKTIGDELWFSIDIDSMDELDALHIAKLLIGAMPDYSSGQDSVFMSGEPGKYDIKLGFETDEHTISKHIPFRKKVFIDILDEYVDIKEVHYNFVTKNIERIYRNRKFLMKQVADLKEFPDDENTTLESLFERLNACAVKIENNILQTKLRSDFIGPDVDRFFRCTKFAIPSYVTIGKRLFNFAFENIKNEVSKFRLKNNPKHTFQGSVFYNCFEEEHLASEMNGVVGDYSTYTIMRDPMVYFEECKNTDTTKIVKFFHKHHQQQYFKYRR